MSRPVLSAVRLAVAIGTMLATPTASLAQGASTGDEILPRPTVSLTGWRLGAELYGGWDSNALDIADGPSDYDYELGADLAWGRQGKLGAFGFTAEGGRRFYAEFDERDAWRAAGGFTAGRQLSRNVVLSAAGGIRYDYTDEFLLVPELGTQLPRTKALGAFGEGELDVKLARRTLWSTKVRYEAVDFEEDDEGDDADAPAEVLPDTRALTVRSALARRVARRDDVSLIYEFLKAKWDVETNDNHAALLGWKHGFSDTWSLELESGVSRVTAAQAERPEVQYLFAGGAVLAARTDRSALSLSYRRSARPGYGTGQILYSDIVQASAQVPLGNRVELGLTGALDRSRDPFDPTYLADGSFVDVRLTTLVFRRVGLVASYRYRNREYFEEPTVSGHRVGLALTTVFEPRRRTADGERGRP